MHISGLTSSQVWLSSSRSLTNIGSGALAPSSTILTTLAAASFVSLRPSAGIVGNFTINARTGAAATAAVQILSDDGSNQLVIATSAAAALSNVAFTCIGTNAVGQRVTNTDGTVAANYNVAAFVWTI